MKRRQSRITYARAHGSLAGVPDEATNLLVSKPVRLPRGGAIATAYCCQQIMISLFRATIAGFNTFRNVAGYSIARVLEIELTIGS